MALVNPALNRYNSNISSPGNAAETSTPAGTTDRRGKRPAKEISSEGPSAVDLLGGTLQTPPGERATAVQSHVAAAEERVPRRRRRPPLTQVHPGPRPRNASARHPPLTSRQSTPPPSFDYAAAAGAALVIAAARAIDYISAKIEKQKEPVAPPRSTKVARTNNATPAPPPAPAPTQARIPDDSDDSENEDGEAPDNLARCRILAPAPPLPPLNPTPAATTFMRKEVRDQAEVFSAIQAHLRHIEFKLQHGDVEGALSNVAQVETLINKRFEVLLVADEAGFEAADRFQLYQAKSVLTSRS
ncbi:unnamed protein product [Closterium sp. NIES-54]